MKFSDIRQMTRPGYTCDHHLHMLPGAIRSYQEEELCPLDMDPDFQRVHVWSPEQQTRYMEFILQGGNSSRDLYFNCPGWMSSFKGPFQLVDGKQRLAACLGFMDGTVEVFGGKCIGDFSDKPFNPTIRFHINDLETRQEILQWYLDINSGGVVHTADELDRVRELLDLEKRK